LASSLTSVQTPSQQAGVSPLHAGLHALTHTPFRAVAPGEQQMLSMQTSPLVTAHSPVTRHRAQLWKHVSSSWNKHCWKADALG
jgi:hypothetical protein